MVPRSLEGRKDDDVEEEEEEIIMESDVIVSTLFKSTEDMDAQDLDLVANRFPSDENTPPAAEPTELENQMMSSDAGSSDEDGVMYDSDGEAIASRTSNPKTSKIPQELLRSQKMIRSK